MQPAAAAASSSRNRSQPQQPRAVSRRDAPSKNTHTHTHTRQHGRAASSRANTQLQAQHAGWCEWCPLAYAAHSSRASLSAPRSRVARSAELAHEDAVRDLKQENDKNVTKLRQQYEREVCGTLGLLFGTRQTRRRLSGGLPPPTSGLSARRSSSRRSFRHSTRHAGHPPLCRPAAAELPTRRTHRFLTRARLPCVLCVRVVVIVCAAASHRCASFSPSTS